jgi:hypothetical protein
MTHDKPKFKKGDAVVYHEGNWKYLILGIYWNEDGKVFCHLACNDESCEDRCHANGRDEVDYVHEEVMPESDLISEDEWDDHSEKGTCTVCCN